MITDDKQLQFLDAHNEAVKNWLESERDRVAGEMMSQPMQQVTQRSTTGTATGNQDTAITGNYTACR
jgi:hypothetical protein